MQFLRRSHIEEMKRHTKFAEQLQIKPIKCANLHVEFMDGTAEDYSINPDDDPNEIIKFIGELNVNRVRKIQRMMNEL